MSNYGLSVMGNIRVFSKTKELKDKNSKKTYEITDVWFNVSEKNDDGSYLNKSMNLIFKRGVERPENNTVINIISAYPIITGTGDYARIALFVQELEPVEKK
jgi:hypothetical protein